MSTSRSVPSFILPVLAAAVICAGSLQVRAAAAACATPLIQTGMATTATSKAYASWKNSYVVPGAGTQLRVQRSAGDNYDTVSEGIAYGMIFAAYANDKTTFDGLWQYAQAHTNANGVMNWRIAADGSTTGWNGATDADEDMAASLIAADTQWGGYKTDAVRLINIIKKYEVEQGSNVLKPGDAWGGSNLLNPSYLTPSYYGVFAQYTGDGSWNDVRTASYATFNAIKNNTDSKTTGFIPDWSRADGYQADGMGYDYGYDGSRAPIRLALASAWDCNADASGLLGTLNAGNAGRTLTSLASSYRLNGTPTGTASGTPLLAAAAAAATVSDNSAYRASAWSALSGTGAHDYFSDSMRLFGMYVAGGLFTNPLTLKPTTPAVQPATTPTAQKSYSLTSASSTATVGSPTVITVQVGAPGTVNGTIVDLEIYDASGSKVAQKFYENQTLSANATGYTVTFTPSKAGTYSIRGGIFGNGWATNMVWNNSITTVEASVAPVIAPSAPVVTAPTPVAEPTPVSTTPATSTTTGTTTTTTTTTTPVTPAPVTTPATPTVVTPPAVLPAPTATTPTLSVWWPGNNQTVTGVQPFKAVLDGTPAASYTMYWQVDGGTLNKMDDSNVDAPHKESLVNVSPWNWRASRTYTITFVAKSVAGETLAQKSSVITVGY